MTTVDKFREAVSRHFMVSRIAAFSTLGVGMLLCYLSFKVSKTVGDLSGELRWVEWGLFVALIIGFITLFAVGTVGTWFNVRRSRDDPRLVCPHCERALQIQSAIVIATRNCPHCGGRVLD